MKMVIDNDLNIINFFDLERLPYTNTTITLGNFDGVHRGHQAIISRMLESASNSGHPVLVVTFFPNPFLFFNHQDKAFYLLTPSEKKTRLVELGVDSVITFQFDSHFANLSPRTFLTGLKHKLGLHHLVVGRDFALGKNRQGSIPVIKSIGKDLSFSVETISPIKTSDEEISSSKIRQFLDQGLVARAAELLGRPYAVSGLVTHGSDRGSKIGLPTANMTTWPLKKLPAVGVYAIIAHLQNKTYHGITNIGYRPTFEDQQSLSVETHILDFDGNIYGETLKLDFIEKIRNEQKFSGVTEFLEQIQRDKATARRIFSHEKS